jgi:Rrf2 family protein
MKLSTRSRYGLRAMLELAIEYGKGPLQIKIIAKREGISNKYLEQLITLLKSSGLVNSVRGPKGGYELAREPKDIKVSEVFTTLEGPLLSVKCIENPQECERGADCVTRNLWSKIEHTIYNVLDSMTLQDLVESGNDPSGLECQQNNNVTEKVK